MVQDLSIAVNDTRISYRQAGQGHLPLIFIHPFPFNKNVWSPQMESLRHNCRMIAYDIRGIGGSGPGNKEINMHTHGDDLVQLMDALGIEQAVVCGLSMGGYILLNAVERYAQRFKGVILCDTQCLADSKENREKRFENIAEIESHGLEKFATAFIEKTLLPDTLKNNAALVEKAKQMILENKPEGVALALKAMAGRSETCSALKQLNLPALILCGKEDTLTPPSLSEFLFTNIPGAKLVEIKRAGHLSNLEQPEEFNRHLREFISTIT